MADKKISDLTSSGAIVGTEELPIVQSGSTVKTTIDTIKTYFNTIYKATFTENTAFNKNFGTTTGTVAEGNDSRLTDARFRKYANYQNTDSASTGSTAEVVLVNLKINGGDMGTNGKLNIDVALYKSGTAGTILWKGYVSTVGTNSIGNTGAPTSSTNIFQYTHATVNLYGGRLYRNLVNKNSDSVNSIYPATANAIPESTPSTGARTAINLNTANDFWVVITATKASAADTSGISDIQLTIDKP